MPTLKIDPIELENFINSGGLADLSDSTDKVSIKTTHGSSTNGRTNETANIENKEIGNQEVTNPSASKSVYPGDIEYAFPKPKDGYQTLNFLNPAEVISFFDNSIAEDNITLWEWQIEISRTLSPIEKPTALHPLKYCLCAANGSGKDAFVIAPFCVWFCLTKIKARVIITSSSGVQLTSQTEAAIKGLCEKVNTYWGKEIFKIRQRYIVCLLTGSEMRMFATDEAGKAEGYHPIEPNAEMAIIVSEAKSVTEDIHSALRRCTGYNYWIESSTPGEPQGFFYKAFNTWKNVRRITSFECPHLPEEEREQDKIDLGEDSALYRSKHLALFTSTDIDTIVTKDVIERLLAQPPDISDYISWPIRVGIDLAAGGDENAICFTKGAQCIKEYYFKEKDTIVTANRISEILMKHNIPRDYDFIFADDGGVGHAIIDNLVHRGWRIKRILNQSSAIQKKEYGNKGAELWYRVKRILEESLFDVSTLTEKTREQIYTRKIKQQNGSRIFLESKRQAKAEGRHSPDRADAFILSMTGLTINNFLEDKKENRDREAAKIRTHQMFSKEQLYNFYEDNITFKNFEILGKQIVKNKVKGSLRAAMKLDTEQEVTFNN